MSKLAPTGAFAPRPGRVDGCPTLPRDKGAGGRCARPPTPGLLRAGLASSPSPRCAFQLRWGHGKGRPRAQGPTARWLELRVAVLVLIMVAESLLWASHRVPVLSSQTRTKVSGNADNAALRALALPGRALLFHSLRGLGANVRAPLHAAALADPGQRLRFRSQNPESWRMPGGQRVRTSPRDLVEAWR